MHSELEGCSCRRDGARACLERISGQAQPVHGWCGIERLHISRRSALQQLAEASVDAGCTRHRAQALLHECHSWNARSQANTARASSRFDLP